MSLTEGLVVYVIIWWLLLFMVLPWGVRRVDPDELLPGEDPGSPAQARMLLKLGVTTVLATVLFGIYYWVAQSGLISFRPNA